MDLSQLYYDFDAHSHTNTQTSRQWKRNKTPTKRVNKTTENSSSHIAGTSFKFIFDDETHFTIILSKLFIKRRHKKLYERIRNKRNEISFKKLLLSISRKKKKTTANKQTIHGWQNSLRYIYKNALKLTHLMGWR